MKCWLHPLSLLFHGMEGQLATMWKFSHGRKLVFAIFKLHHFKNFYWKMGLGCPTENCLMPVIKKLEWKFPFPPSPPLIHSWLACNWCFLASSSSCFFNAPARSRSRLGQIPFSVESRHSLFSISLLFPLFKIFENVNGCFLHHSRKHRNRMVVPECP